MFQSPMNCGNLLDVTFTDILAKSGKRKTNKKNVTRKR